jgi:hypothetical protein
MRPNQRVRFHDGESGSPVNEAGEDGERDPCGIVGPTRSDTTFRIQSQLLSKEQILRPDGIFADYSAPCLNVEDSCAIP